MNAPHAGTSTILRDRRGSSNRRDARATMAKRDEILCMFDLADRKGFDVTQSTMRDHVRLIDGEGKLVRNKNGGAAH